MKQKDVALVIVIAFISVVVSLLVSSKIFVTKDNHTQTVKAVDTINSTFANPDSKYFNNKSIDPTQLVQYGNQNNQNPFNGTSSN